MGCVDALCAGLTDLARPVHFGAVLVPGLSATAQNALLTLGVSLDSYVYDMDIY